MKKLFVDKKLLIPFVIAILGALIIIVSLFLPYASATDVRMEEINNTPDVIIDSEMGITTSDLENISIVTFANYYSTNSISIFASNEGYIYLAFVITITVFAVAALLFALLKKATPIIIFSILNLLVIAFQHFDFTLRGDISSKYYDCGIAVYLFYIAIALSLIGAIWMLIMKIKIKKQNIA